MVREANISQEQVNAAADALRAAGVKPTVRAVRDKLGTGSQATVMRLLGVWKSNQVQASETPLTLPAPFQRVLVDYLAQTVAEEKQALSAELAEQQQVNTDLGLENERLAEQLSALQSELAAIQSERDALVGRVHQLETDLGLARGEAEQERSAAEAVRVELAKAQLRLEAVPLLQEEITATENALDKERSARAAAEQAAAVAQAQLAAEQRARERVESELEAVLAREVRMADQVNDLTSRMADGRLARVRPERDVRRPLRKATAGKKAD